ncbi:MAG: tRNA 4-thiouridine(8) synthase ThiI [Deltaproteobacteria bacterium]|nr:tRNA 4-thiouridine(8) synthase ThiI [Deltaproteobacteria bacterium]
MKVKGIGLFSGGLDSILASCVLREQGIEVTAVTFETPFFSAAKAKMTAKRIGLPLIVREITTEHLAMLHAPRYGYGKNMNPCIDCHTLMLKIAGQLMDEAGADFVFTGEVMGQRPMSQGKQSLLVVAKNAGYPDRILRPLSARLLPETEPEREGKVDRSRLCAISGRGRKEQMEMAARFGITSYPAPAGGCLLTDPIFSGRLRDLFAHHPAYRIRDIELLKVGRHFRLDAATKVVIGRNAPDNATIEGLADSDDAIIRIARVPGPVALIPSGGDETTRALAAALCGRYSDAGREREVVAQCLHRGKTTSFPIAPATPEEAARLIL